MNTIVTITGTSEDYSDEIIPGDLVEVSIDLDDVPEETLIEYVDNLKPIEASYFSYPNNSVRIRGAYETLLKNLQNVPLEEIETIIEKYNLI